MTSESITKILATDGDGTLFDTHANIVGSMIYSVGEILGRVISEDDLRPYFGWGIGRFYEMMGALEHQVEKCIDAHRVYQKANFHLVEAFPGAVDALHELKNAGVPSVLVTSRAGESLDILLNRTGAGEVLEAVISAHDVQNHKPDPEPFVLGLQRVSEKLRVPIPRDIYVFGDTDPDIEGGQNLHKLWTPHHQVHTIWAAYGQKKEDGIKAVPDFVAHNVIEMPRILLGRQLAA
jgi:pyrophosphatase PpaX